MIANTIKLEAHLTDTVAQGQLYCRKCEHFKGVLDNEWVEYDVRTLRISIFVFFFVLFLKWVNVYFKVGVHWFNDVIDYSISNLN